MLSLCFFVHATHMPHLQDYDEEVIISDGTSRMTPHPAHFDLDSISAGP